ncbi:MAG: hypothetical protein ACTSXT_03860 [Candidatus Helarchaeota archaeon]
MKSFKFMTGTNDSNYEVYIDAFDYSWAWGYYEGRNLYDKGGLTRGHYPNIERFNVIILEVQDPIGPFVKGINVILIPVSLFLNTKLHAMIENQEIPDVLSENSASGIAADFYGINRNEESVSEHVEGIISKNQTTANEAMAILYLLLKNATDFEVYEYKVCNEAGSVEKLGLASDILKLVPFDAQETQNGPTGSKPNSWFVWLVLLITGLILVAMPILATIYFFVKLFQFLANCGLELLASFTESAKQALENAVKIIIFKLLFEVIAVYWYVVESILILLFSKIKSLKPNNEYFMIFSKDINTINFKIMTKKEAQNYINLALSINWWYVNIVDLELPCYKLKLEKNNISFFIMRKIIIPNFGIKKVQINNMGLKSENLEINKNFRYNCWKNFNKIYLIKNKVRYIIDKIINQYINKYKGKSIENYCYLQNLVLSSIINIKEFEFTSLGEFLGYLGIGSFSSIIIISIFIYIYITCILCINLVCDSIFSKLFLSHFIKFTEPNWKSK